MLTGSFIVSHGGPWSRSVFSCVLSSGYGLGRVSLASSRVQAGLGRRAGWAAGVRTAGGAGRPGHAMVRQGGRRSRSRKGGSRCVPYASREDGISPCRNSGVPCQVPELTIYRNVDA